MEKMIEKIIVKMIEIIKKMIQTEDYQEDGRGVAVRGRLEIPY